MMPPALNPFGLGAPPLQSLSRDNMPLPYGEHHLMQVTGQHELLCVPIPVLCTELRPISSLACSAGPENNVGDTRVNVHTREG